jgi:hypothetical protein
MREAGMRLNLDVGLASNRAIPAQSAKLEPQVSQESAGINPLISVRKASG